MNARVTFLPSTLKQEGTVGKILKWMQDNPNSTRSTNISLMAATIANSGFGLKINTIKITLNKMRNNQMILRYGGKKHARFMINYYQKDIPGYILARAPQDIQDKVRAMKENLLENQYIDDEGCLVTKPEKTEETKEDEEEEEEEEPKAEAKEEPTEETTKQDVVVPVEIKDDAKGLNITISLNLTINR